MTINQKIEGLVSFVSNSPGVPTGYGQQGELLVNNMLRAGMTVAAISNYGHEAGIGELKLQAGKIPHYPRSFTGYSTDTVHLNHAHFKAKHRDLKEAVFILYDSWVYNEAQLDNLPVIIWAPCDHITLPPAVAHFLKKPNVQTISMAPDGAEQFSNAGIENTYIPHTIDTKVYKPTESLRGKPAREYLGIKDSDFLVGMVAANKASGQIHRKAYAENILAFSMLLRKYPDAKLYIHADPTRAMGGFNLINLLGSCGVPPESVIFPDPLDLRYGISKQDMAALYSTFDVLLATSYGEGFGVPTVEAQACGTRAIVSNWAASKDLVSSDGFKVEGLPLWDEAQAAWFKLPIVDSILFQLEAAYNSERGISKASIEFAKQFDDRKIWAEKWLPFWSDYFAK